MPETITEDLIASNIMAGQLIWKSDKGPGNWQPRLQTISLREVHKLTLLKMAYGLISRIKLPHDTLSSKKRTKIVKISLSLLHDIMDANLSESPNVWKVVNSSSLPNTQFLPTAYLFSNGVSNLWLNTANSEGDGTVPSFARRTHTVLQLFMYDIRHSPLLRPKSTDLKLKIASFDSWIDVFSQKIDEKLPRSSPAVVSGLGWRGQH